MRKLGVFNLVTLDGHFAGAAGDIFWYKVGPISKSSRSAIPPRATRCCSAASHKS